MHDENMVYSPTESIKISQAKLYDGKICNRFVIINLLNLRQHLIQKC